MIVFVYIVLVFLILRFTVTVFNFLSNPKLGHYGKKFDDKVSIIFITSGGSAEPLLESISTQDYKSIETFAITSKDELAKVASQVTGRYLLCIDSESVINKGLINSLVYRAKVFDLKYIALIPNRSFSSFNDYLLQPIMDFLILNLLPLRLVRILNLPSLTVASQRFMFYEVAFYRRRMEFPDEEKDDRKSETLLANGMLIISRKTLIKTASRELLNIFDGNTLTIFLYLLLSIAGPIVLFLKFELEIVFLPLGLIFLMRIMISFLTRQNPFVNVILHPLQMVALTGLLFASTLKKLFTSGIHTKE
jgi:hypothetical protein